MKGWRPSACPLGLETGSGSFAGEFLPDIGSIGLSFPRGPGPRGLTRGSVDPSFPFRMNEAPRPPGSDGNGAQASAIRKGASPSPRSKRPEELKMKTKESTHNQGERAAPAPPAASFKA